MNTLLAILLIIAAIPCIIGEALILWTLLRIISDPDTYHTKGDTTD